MTQVTPSLSIGGCPIERALTRGGVALAILVTVGFAATHTRSELFRFLHYVTPMALFAPLLLANRFVRGCCPRRRDLFIDLIAIAMAASRLVTMAWPFSGHLVLLTYGVLTGRTRLVRGLAIVLTLHATALKLLVWHSGRTWAWGIVIGVCLACLRSRAGAAPGRQVGNMGGHAGCHRPSAPHGGPRSSPVAYAPGSDW